MNNDDDSLAKSIGRNGLETETEVPPPAAQFDSGSITSKPSSEVQEDVLVDDSEPNHPIEVPDDI